MIKLLLFLIISCHFLYSNINLDDYYKISNRNLKILKLDEGELVFYGSDGGVLRTYDNGESYHQIYSGTKSNIMKMIYHQNQIFAVTLDGEFMKSDDKGKLWNINKLTDSFTDLTVADDILYLSTNINSIYISSDFGNSWNEILVSSIDSLNSISYYNNKIIITTKKQEIKYSDLSLNSWEDLEVPFDGIWRVINKNNTFYLNNRKDIAKLNFDFTWAIYNIFGINRTFHFIENFDSFLIFESSLSPSVDYFRYDKSQRRVTYSNKIDDFYFGKYPEELFNFAIEDVDVSKGKIYLSNYHKTIFTTNDLENWKLESYTPMIKNNVKIIDSLNWILTSWVSYYPSFTTNGGVTFQKGERFTGYIDNLETNFMSLYSIFDDQGNGIFLYSSIAQNEKYYEFTSSYRFGISNDGGRTNSLINLKFSPKYKDFGTPDYSIHSWYKDDFICTIYYPLRRQNEDNTFSDSINVHEFFKVNKFTHQYEKFYEIVDSFRLREFYLEDNKMWFYGYNELKNSEYSYFLSEDDGATFKKVFTLPTGKHRSFFKSRNGNYYSISDVIYEIDENYNIKIIQFPDDYKNVNLQNFWNPNNGYLEDKNFYLDKEIIENGDTTITFVLINFDFEEGIKIKEIELPQNFSQFKENGVSILSRFGGIQNFLYKKIDDLYYSSVVNLQPPPIWTYPPYPNPVKDRLKMKFYSAMMGEIAKLKVELIHIGTGRSYQINNFDLNIQDDYWGEIEVDVTGYIRGAYLINFKLGDSNKSEAIIIE